jgi:hypothetical protein
VSELIIKNIIFENWEDESVPLESNAITWVTTRGKIGDWLEDINATKYCVAVFHELTESQLVSAEGTYTPDTIIVDIYLKVSDDYDSMIAKRSEWSDFVWQLLHDNQNTQTGMEIVLVNRRCQELSSSIIRELIRVKCITYNVRGE